MSFKAKTVLNKDIRVFKQDIDTMEDGLEAIKKFIKEKYAIEGAFSIQYEDEEKDIITVASSEDLEEAYNQAESNGTVLKLLVVPENSNAPVYEFTSELDKSAINEQHQEEEKVKQGNNDFSSSEEEDQEEQEDKSSKECFGKELLQDLIKNEEFRKEFINFIVSFIKILQQDIEKYSNEALIQALSKHENISQHPSMKKLLDIFPLLFEQVQPLLFFINTINADNIGVWINNIINLLSNVDLNQLESLPMMIMSWLGIPFGQHHGYGHGFGPHYGAHGPHSYPSPHGPHGFGHGHHMPPPPPPPFMFGNLFNGFGPFMPPPPPPTPQSSCPFFNGFSHGQGYHNNPYGSFYHGRKHGHRHGPHGHHGPHHRFGGCPRHMFNSMNGMFGQNNNNEEQNNNNNNNGPCYGKNMWCGKNKEEKGKKCPWKRYQRCNRNNNNNDNNKCEWKKEKLNKNKDYKIKIMNDEVTLIDKAYVLPGQVVIKTWHIKNIGNKDLPQDIKLKYYGKPFNPIINGVEFNVPNLKINEEGDISVIIETPKDNIIGKQKADFRLVLTNSNEIIGPIFRVRIMIVNEQDQLNNDVIINSNDNNEIEIKKEIEEEKKENNDSSDVIEKLKEIKEKEEILLKEKQQSSSPSSFVDLNIPKIEEEEESDDAMVLEEQEIRPIQDQVVQDQVVQEKSEPIIVSNLNNSIKEEYIPYIYENQLNMILGMGFNDVDKIRNLLNANKGDVNVVINQLFA